jgi:hypothetical protein
MSSISLHGHHWSKSGLFHRHGVADAGKHSTQFVPTIGNDERVLYRSKAGSETTVVATDYAMHYRTDGSAWRRVAWCDVVAAGSSKDDGTTVLRLWPDASRESSIAFAADGHFAEFAAERVAHVRVFCRRIVVTPSVTGAVEAVRVANTETLAWRVHLDVPAHGDNPLVANQCARVVTELRALVGC